MENVELINVRGQNLLARSMWVAGQEFLIIAVPIDRQDAVTSDIYNQQNIEITPGLKIMEKATGKLFEVLSGPNGYSRHVTIKDVRWNLTPVNIPEDEIRQKFRFTAM
jgi:hypothetical protein